MKNLIFLIGLLLSTVAVAQKCPDYNEYIAEGDKELQKGNKADFE